MPKQRQIIIVAEPNGAGKTTFAREYLLKEADCPDFVNVDLIAAGLSPFDPDRASIRASRIMEWHDNSGITPQLISAGENER